MAQVRTIHIRCATWDQVEALYQRKLRRGNLLSMRIASPPPPGARVSLGIELPTQVVIAIEANVDSAAPIDGADRSWVELELRGLDEALLGRLRSMVAAGRAATAVQPLDTSGARGEPDRDRVTQRSNALAQVKSRTAHEVLGVPHDAPLATVRAAWIAQLRQAHPDQAVDDRSGAMIHLAEELTIHINRAYVRLRATARDEQALLGPVLLTPHAAPLATVLATLVAPAMPRPGEGSGASDVEAAARVAMAQGAFDDAKEALAAALVATPRQPRLRALYLVAAAIVAARDGHAGMALGHLEAAVAAAEAAGGAHGSLAQHLLDAARADRPAHQAVQDALRAEGAA